jgi:hypothetical protein
MNDNWREQLAKVRKLTTELAKDVAEEEYLKAKKVKAIEDSVTEFFYTQHANYSACKGCNKNCVVVKQLDRINNGQCFNYTVDLSQEDK